MVGVKRNRERQAHADKAFSCGITEAQTGDRENLVWQFQDLGDGVSVVANHADRATAEAGGLGREDEGLHDQSGVDRGVKEAFEPAVGLLMAA